MSPPHLSLLFDLILPSRPFKAAYFSFRLVPLLAVSAGCYIAITSKSSNEEEEKFLARVEWLPDPMTSRSFNARRACARGLRYLLCVCVCPRSADAISYIIAFLQQIEYGYSLFASIQGFQLTTLSKNAKSFTSYSLFRFFCRPFV